MKEALSRITNILNEYLEKFDCNAEPDSNFAYISDTNSIHYALAVAEEHEKSFMEFLHKLFPEVNADIFLWSLFHEIGHNETEDDFTDEEEEEYREKACSNISNEEYYNLPMEYAASYWAGTYMKEHPKEVKNLWKKLQPAIKDFYEKMEIKQ